MEFIGSSMIIGGLFGAYLFNFNVRWGDKLAVVIRNGLIGVAIAGFMFLSVDIYRFSKSPLYEYRVNAYYIDGGCKMLLFESRKDPKIEAFRGTYLIRYGGCEELGVVRFEIVSKKKVGKEKSNL